MSTFLPEAFGHKDNRGEENEMPEKIVGVIQEKSEGQPDQEETPVWIAFLAALLQAVFFIMAGLCMYHSVPEEVHDYAFSLLPSLGISMPLFMAIVVLVIVWAVVNVVFSVLSKKISKFHTTISQEIEYPKLIQQMKEVPFAKRLIMLFVLALSEEILCRMGMMILFLFLLSKVMGFTPLAVLLSAVIASIVFSIVHDYYSHLSQYVMLFVNGMIFSFGYLLTGSILAVAIVHCVTNVVAFAILRRDGEIDVDDPRLILTTSITEDMPFNIED